jgi:hypothetical protein
MSDTGSSPSVSDSLNAADWAYAQAGTPYVDGNTTLPTGFSYFMVNGQTLIDYNPATGFYGAALVNAAGQVIVTFEGTNVATGNDVFTTGQTLDDLAITAGVDAASYQTALSYTETVLADAAAAGYATYDVFLAGHSLGAAEVEYVAAKTGLSGTTFGAPGLPSADIPATTTATVTDFVERGDPVGNYAQGGNDFALLQNQNVEHFGTTAYIGSYDGTALLLSADATYTAALQAPTEAEQAAGIAATVAILGEAAKDYHVLATYAADLGVTLEGGDKSAAGMGLGLPSGSMGGSAALPGLILSAQGSPDIPGFDATAPGAVTVSDGLIILNTGAVARYSLALPGATGSTFSLSSDGAGGTQVTAGAASDGYVFAGLNGATVSGDARPLYVMGGGGAVSVLGGSGDTTMFGATSSTATTFLMGGAGSNFLQGGAGATTISAGTGASTLVGGTGPTLMLANGAAPDLMVAGAGATTVNGTTGTGPAQIFAGSGPDQIALGAGADTMIGGAGFAHVSGGTGSDVYGFIDGHAGGQDIISGLRGADTIVFGAYGGDPIVAEGVIGGGDLITLSDGTLILLQGIDHKVFS